MGVISGGECIRESYLEVNEVSVSKNGERTT